MAKIDTKLITGYDTMTPEQKLEALQGFEFPDPDYTGYVKKDLYDKAASDAASWKKKHNALLSEEEQKKQEADEKWADMEKELAGLRKEKTVSQYTAQLLKQGYDEALAASTAAAMESGDMGKVFANNQKFLEGYAKRIIAEKLKGTPRGADGGTGGTMTKDMFRKMSPSERFAYSKEHPEEYRALYETGTGADQ